MKFFDIVLLTAIIVIVSATSCSESVENNSEFRVDSIVEGLQMNLQYWDKNNNMVRDESYFKDSTSGRYVLCGTLDNTYDSLGRARTQVFCCPDMADMKLRPLEYDEYDYDSLNRVIESRHSVSSGDSGVWMYVSRLTYNYRDTLMINNCKYSWEPAQQSWRKMEEHQYIYDEASHLNYRIDLHRDKFDTSKFVESKVLVEPKF